MPGGIGSSGVKDKSISSMRESLSSMGIGDGEKDLISALEFSKKNSSGGRGDELSYNNLLVRQISTILATESDEFIKSCVENLVPNPSESKGENGCDVLACFITFSNVLFDADYDFYSVDDQSLSDEDFLKEIYSNPLFDEEIISMKIDPHHFNDESDLIESMLNHDSSIISSS
nr:hypothetical protein [Tanacetum cinerariifolium]